MFKQVLLSTVSHRALMTRMEPITVKRVAAALAAAAKYLPIDPEAK